MTIVILKQHVCSTVTIFCRPHCLGGSDVNSICTHCENVAQVIRFDFNTSCNSNINPFFTVSKPGKGVESRSICVVICASLANGPG